LEKGQQDRHFLLDIVLAFYYTSTKDKDVVGRDCCELPGLDRNVFSNCEILCNFVSFVVICKRYTPDIKGTHDMPSSIAVHYQASWHGGIDGSSHIKGKELLEVERDNLLEKPSKRAQESISLPLRVQSPPGKC
jgi:hypothetical protein